MENQPITDNQIMQPSDQTPSQRGIEISSKILAGWRSNYWKILSVVFVVLLLGATLIYMNLQRTTNQTIITNPQAPSLTPISGETINWNTYNDQNRMYSFKYPPDLYAVELLDQRVSFYENKEKYKTYLECKKNVSDCYNPLVLHVNVIPHNKAGYKSLKDQYTDVKDVSESTKIKTYQDKQNRSWILVDNGEVTGSFNSTAELEVGNTIYLVDIQVGREGLAGYLKKPLDDNLPKEGNLLVNQILSTFTFVELNPEWETYANDALKLSFQYPANWIVRDVNESSTMDLCDLHAINPDRYPNSSVKYGACEASGVTPTTSIMFGRVLNIRPKSSLQESYYPNPAIQLSYYENKENLSIQEFNNKYLSEAVAAPTYEKITNPNKINAYYDKEHYCVEICQVYVWSYADKIFILINFPTDAVDQDKIFHQVFNSLKMIE
jgi:hypothetical protein